MYDTATTCPQCGTPVEEVATQQPAYAQQSTYAQQQPAYNPNPGYMPNPGYPYMPMKQPVDRKKMMTVFGVCYSIAITLSLFFMGIAFLEAESFLIVLSMILAIGGFGSAIALFAFTTMDNAPLDRKLPAVAKMVSGLAVVIISIILVDMLA